MLGSKSVARVEAVIQTINTATESITVGPSECGCLSSSTGIAMLSQEGAPRASRGAQDARTLRRMELRAYVQEVLTEIGAPVLRKSKQQYVPFAKHTRESRWHGAPESRRKPVVHARMGRQTGRHRQVRWRERTKQRRNRLHDKKIVWRGVCAHTTRRRIRELGSACVWKVEDAAMLLLPALAERILVNQSLILKSLRSGRRLWSGRRAKDWCLPLLWCKRCTPTQGGAPEEIPVRRNLRRTEVSGSQVHLLVPLAQQVDRDHPFPVCRRAWRERGHARKGSLIRGKKYGYRTPPGPDKHFSHGEAQAQCH